MDRRDILKGTATLALTAPFFTNCNGGGIGGGGNGVGNGETGLPNRGNIVRPNLANLAADSDYIEAYRVAVQRMMRLPATDGRSWYHQARIHFENCAHGNWYFLPWHRAYIAYFEEIVRQMSGFDQFVLPYWDWINDRQMPTAFRAAATPNNPLDPANLDFGRMETEDESITGRLRASNDRTGRRRWISSNGLVGEDGQFTNERMNEQLRIPTFRRFGSAESRALRPQVSGTTFEDAYHGAVHVDVGGPMAALFSPLDPIFWVHHCNVDRLWYLWQRINGDFTNSTWRDLSLPAGMFALGNGNSSPATQIGTWEHQRGVTYERVVGQIADSEARSLSERILPISFVAETTTLEQTEIARTSEVTDVPFDGMSAVVMPVAMSMNNAFSDPVMRQPAVTSEARIDRASPAEVGIGQRLLAEFELMPEVMAPQCRLRLFVNCDYLTKDTPSTDPHFVSRISLFGFDHGGGSHGDDHAEMGGRITVDLTPALMAIARSGEVARDEITLQIQSNPRSNEVYPSERVTTIKGVRVFWQ